MTTLHRYTIGTTVFDEGTMELVVDGLVVDIQPRPLRLLSLLLARAGNVVTREEILETVWSRRLKPGDSNVLPNAVTKLRTALGGRGAALIENVPRHGYRFTGRFDRVPVGRAVESALALVRGERVPSRDAFVLERLLGQSVGREVWSARHRTTGERRVYKFASDAERIAELKREVGFARVLRDQLGARDDMVHVIAWNFSAAPYFVESEYGGADLERWSKGPGGLGGRSREERLQLFAAIATPVEAAHGLGVLHRDIKPRNVLIEDGALRCRLIDFGSGSLIDPERLAQGGVSLSATLTTGLRGEVTQGTFAYLAPEVHLGRPCTIASDVYALGVLLYQLLVGDLSKPLASGWQREIDDPLLRDDIDQATQGDPGARLQGVGELLVRIRTLTARRERREREEAEAARALDDAEALRRSRARRPWLVATMASLVMALAISVVAYWKIRTAQRSLASQYATAQGLNAFLSERFIAMADPAVTGRSDVTVADAARRAADAIDPTLATAGPEIRATLHATMQRAFSQQSDFERSIREGEAALAALAEQANADPRERLAVELALAGDRVEFGQAGRAGRDATGIASEIAAQRLEGSAYEARLWRLRGAAASEGLAIDEAIEDYGRAWAIVSALPQPPAQLIDGVEFEYADVLRMNARFADAELRFRELLARQSARWGATDWRTCYTDTALAQTLGYLHRVDEGVALAQRSIACLDERLGRDNLRTAKALDALAGLEFQRDRYDAAAALYADLAERYARISSAISLNTVSARVNGALALQYAGHAVEAERAYAAIVDAVGAARPTSDPQMQTVRYHLVDCRLNLHRKEGVAELLEGLDGEALGKAQIAPDWNARLDYQRGRLAIESGDFRAAIPRLESAAAVIAARNPDGPIEVAGIRKLIARARDRLASSRGPGGSRRAPPSRS